MLEGLYSAASGLVSQQRRLDALAGDVANVSTTGYKRLRVGFRDLLYAAPGRGALEGVQTGVGAASSVIGRGTEQGALRRTDRPLDLAISGDGFFSVRARDGRLGLTRDGSFSLDPDGSLRTARGERLVPPLRLPRGAQADDVQVGADGTVRAGGQTIGRLGLVTVASPGALGGDGNGLLIPTAASGAPVATRGARVEQGALEASNVDMGDAMVDMMDAQRSFQLASRAVQLQDQMMEIANGVKR